MPWLKVHLRTSGSMSCCKSNAKNRASCIDGMSDGADIADSWASKFKDLLTSPNPDAHRQLEEALSSLKISSEELEATRVTPEIVMNSFQKLKRGKSLMVEV